MSSLRSTGDEQRRASFVNPKGATAGFARRMGKFGSNRAAGRLDRAGFLKMLDGLMPLDEDAIDLWRQLSIGQTGHGIGIEEGGGDAELRGGGDGRAGGVATEAEHDDRLAFL